MTDVPSPAVADKGPGAEGVVSTWFVRDGDTVEVDQLLAEVQVDKVAVEVPAPAAGTVPPPRGGGAGGQQGEGVARIR